MRPRRAYEEEAIIDVSVHACRNSQRASQSYSRLSERNVSVEFCAKPRLGKIIIMVRRERQRQTRRCDLG
jgi:hypothetical protein